jgi:hypothetical protein
MPYQVHLTCKDGTVRADLGVGLEQLPSVGDEISYPTGGQVVTAKVTAIREMPVRAEIGQSVKIVDAKEI